jgi:hypothetical protein
MFYFVWDCYVFLSRSRACVSFWVFFLLLLSFFFGGFWFSVLFLMLHE